MPSSHEAVLFVWKQPEAGLQASSVQALLSLHKTAVTSVNTHPKGGEQLSWVQTLPSLQTVGRPGWQLPPPQTSPVVHGLLSLQLTVLFVWMQPVAGLQPSVVQRLWSSQATVLLMNTQPSTGSHESEVQALASLHTVGAPGRQVPLPQVSPVVHALPSSHAAVLFV